MKISFNPSNSNKNILDLIKNNKDIIFDLKGHSIFARGVEFKGTDTDTWRPVVDNLTSDFTTSSLSAKQGKVLKALIDSKSNSDHNHDGRYVRYYAVTTLDCNNLAAGLTAARISATNAAHTNHSAYLYISDVETPFQIQIPDSGIPYIYKRYYGSGKWSEWFKLNAGYADSAGSVAWANVTGKPSSYTPSDHTHTVFKNNLMIKGTNGISDSASIHLGIGDSDTGFKWISDGVCQIYANNVAVGQWTSGGMNWFKNPTVNGNKVWNAGNDGSGSGLDADMVDGEHASNFSYTHQTSFDFSKGKSGRIVTFDQSNTDYGWINGFASTYDNYLTSVIFNTHRTSNWYVGYIEAHSGIANGLLAVKQLAFLDSKVADSDKLDGVHLNGIFTGFSYAQSRLTATIGTVSKTVNVTGSYPSIEGVTMNTIASYGNCMGLANLASSNSNVNPNNQTSWHHFINMSFNTESANMRQTQFAIKAGTTEVWVRSRAGGSISDSSAWAAPWVRLARITDVNNYYWANVKISTSSSTTTSPTFSNVYLGNSLYLNTSGSNSIYTGPNDSANGVGGPLNNLVFSSWYGVSFTTSCAGLTYTNKNAVSINCRTGQLYAREVQANGFMHTGHNNNDAVLLAGGGYKILNDFIRVDKSNNYTDREHYNLAFHKLSGLCLVWVDGHVKKSITTSFTINSTFYPYNYDRDQNLKTVYLMSGNNYITINAIGTVTIHNAADHYQRVGFFYTGRRD